MVSLTNVLFKIFFITPLLFQKRSVLISTDNAVILKRLYNTKIRYSIFCKTISGFLSTVYLLRLNLFKIIDLLSCLRPTYVVMHIARQNLETKLFIVKKKYICLEQRGHKIRFVIRDFHVLIKRLY